VSLGIFLEFFRIFSMALLIYLDISGFILAQENISKKNIPIYLSRARSPDPVRISPRWPCLRPGRSPSGPIGSRRPPPHCVLGVRARGSGRLCPYLSRGRVSSHACPNRAHCLRRAASPLERRRRLVAEPPAPPLRNPAASLQLQPR
jgi:hypothetical protein